MVVNQSTVECNVGEERNVEIFGGAGESLGQNGGLYIRFNLPFHRKLSSNDAKQSSRWDVNLSLIALP